MNDREETAFVARHLLVGTVAALIVAAPLASEQTGTNALPPAFETMSVRYVAFDSVTPGPHAPCVTVFLRDRQQTTARPFATAWDDPSGIVCATRPAISADGQWVAFESTAQDLVEGIDANGSQSDVYIVNTTTGHASRISVASDGTQSPAGNSYAASLSAPGRLVAFTSTACLDGGPSDSSARSAVAPCKPWRKETRTKSRTSTSTISTASQLNCSVGLAAGRPPTARAPGLPSPEPVDLWPLTPPHRT